MTWNIFTPSVSACSRYLVVVTRLEKCGNLEYFLFFYSQVVVNYLEHKVEEEPTTIVCF